MRGFGILRRYLLTITLPLFLRLPLHRFVGLKVRVSALRLAGQWPLLAQTRVPLGGLPAELRNAKIVIFLAGFSVGLGEAKTKVGV